MAKRKSNSLKRTIKYLAVCKNPEIISRIIAKSPDNVIKSICNAALNTAEGSVILKKKQKQILGAHRGLIHELVQKGESPQRKKNLLLQKGGSVLGILIPTILGAVLTSLGSKLFNGN